MLWRREKRENVKYAVTCPPEPHHQLEGTFRWRDNQRDKHGRLPSEPCLRSVTHNIQTLLHLPHFASYQNKETRSDSMNAGLKGRLSQVYRFTDETMISPVCSTGGHVEPGFCCNTTSSSCVMHYLIHSSTFVVDYYLKDII